MALLLLANAVAFHETRRTNHAGDTGKDGRKEGRIRIRKAKFIFACVALPPSFSLSPIIHFVLIGGSLPYHASRSKWITPLGSLCFLIRNEFSKKGKRCTLHIGSLIRLLLLLQPSLFPFHFIPSFCRPESRLSLLANMRQQPDTFFKASGEFGPRPRPFGGMSWVSLAFGIASLLPSPTNFVVANEKGSSAPFVFLPHRLSPSSFCREIRRRIG